ncbi:antagonist of KipI [Halobacillus alkaliphilus]|uniref:Antagonist of KipI n=1 Tax=Halobacillus alkaliphilus TaxID=396056 RepID=A0A1I2T0H6_9BACI|nr:biotin-dependent carboxyltransferase family protein [Halobacillus alkaliphilus]SFG56707.1 antagonist of KipI [Halobacillus alkaliphilus]
MLKVLKSGLLTTIQDMGRYGYQKYGVITSGAMDPEAHRIANLLVGNDQRAPTMEITLKGPVLEFQEDALIAVCGGKLSPMIDGETVGLWRPIYIKKGSELRFGNPKKGFRAYLSIAGGLDVASVMGSASTYLRAEIGGYQGRALDKGDTIDWGKPSESSKQTLKDLKEMAGSEPYQAMDWFVATEFSAPIQGECTLKVMEGREFQLFTEESQSLFFEEAFQIDSQSDRMGYRLQGNKLKLENQKDMISEAVTFGTIQVPAEGNPIILLADRQTTGGYPKIGQVATVDLPRIAQLKPGEQVNFQQISHKQAQYLLLEREKQIQQLEQGIKFKNR